MLPPELVEQIIDHAWGCLTTSSHRHGYSMTQWMLVSRDWLEIVLSVVFRNLWITSNAHINYIIDCGNTQKSFIFELAGIPGPEIYRHISQTCRSLIISVYYSFDGQYASQCEQLIEYATSDSQEDFHPGLNRYKQKYTIPVERICQAISDFTPHISSLHFVLIDCTATYGGWDMYSLISSILPMWYPFSLTELHISFAYTSPHPALLLDAPRGTFFPPRSHSDLPRSCCFEGVRRLVIRDANADFVAFMTAACPWLKRVESTAEFSVADVPSDVPEYVRDRLVFVRLPRTATYPGVTTRDTMLYPSEEYRPKTFGEWRKLSERDWYILSRLSHDYKTPSGCAKEKLSTEPTKKEPPAAVVPDERRRRSIIRFLTCAPFRFPASTLFTPGTLMRI